MTSSGKPGNGKTGQISNAEPRAALGAIRCMDHPIRAETIAICVHARDRSRLFDQKGHQFARNRPMRYLIADCAQKAFRCLPLFKDPLQIVSRSPEKFFCGDQHFFVFTALLVDGIYLLQVHGRE